MKSNKKRELIDSSYNLFITKGYDNTSIDEIIKEVNIAKGTFYYYFESKEEILNQVINTMIDKEIEKASQFIGMPIPVEQKVVGIISSLRPSNNEVNIANALNDESNIKMHNKVNKRIIEEATILLKDVVLEGIEKGIFDCNNIEERIKMILIMSNELFDNELISKKDVEVFIDTTEKVLGAKSGSLNFILELIGGHNEKNN